MGTCQKCVIYRQCVTLRNGRRICRPAGKAFRIRIKCDCGCP